MSTITFGPEFETGISEIDTQHRRLFALVDRLNNLNQSEGEISPDKQRDIFEDLKRYVSIHFFLEERIMEDEDYPRLESHRKSHLNFEGKISQLGKKLEDITPKEAREIVGQLAPFLNDWLISHIKKSDMEYAAVMPHRRNSRNH